MESEENLQTIEPLNKHRIMELWKYLGTKYYGTTIESYKHQNQNKIIKP